jgi:hypothetical protein
MKRVEKYPAAAGKMATLKLPLFSIIAGDGSKGREWWGDERETEQRREHEAGKVR